MKTSLRSMRSSAHAHGLHGLGEGVAHVEFGLFVQQRHRGTSFAKASREGKHARRFAPTALSCRPPWPAVRSTARSPQKGGSCQLTLSNKSRRVTGNSAISPSPKLRRFGAARNRPGGATLRLGARRPASRGSAAAARAPAGGNDAAAARGRDMTKAHDDSVAIGGQAARRSGRIRPPGRDEPIAISARCAPLRASLV